MKRILSLTAILFAAAFSIRAQTATAYPVVGGGWHQAQVYVPNVTTAVTTADSLLGHLHLANVTGSTVVVTITDNSTNCNGAACQLWPAIPIAGNTVYENDFGGMLCTGGIKWSANTQNAVDGYMRGNYVLPILSHNISVPTPFGDIPVPNAPQFVARADVPSGRSFSNEGMRLASFP